MAAERVRIKAPTLLPKGWRGVSIARVGGEMLGFLFSFNGRVRRLHWWLVRIGVWVGFFAISMAVILALRVLFPEIAVGNDLYLEASDVASAIWAVVFFTLIIASIWIELAISVKCWHDRDKSGFWILIAFVPLVGPIWTLVECGLLDGTQGPNKYGPSPKGIVGDQAEVFS
jgi:uncharacterized membrane protein YhaH (DUF805 family)